MAALLMLGTLPVSAQQESQDQQDEYEYVFLPHWYGQLQIGGQYTEGEVSFGDLLSPNAQIAVGYNFSPILGARLNVNAWQSRAGWSLDKTEKWKWNYVAPVVDLTIDLTNLFGGFNPERKLSFGMFLGVGANIAFKNDEAWQANTRINQNYYNGTSVTPTADQLNHQNLSYLWDGTKVRFVGQAGLNLDYRFNDKWSAGLELQINSLNDHYNSKRAGNPDFYYNALVGVKYNFGSTHTKRVKPRPEPEIRYIDRIVEKVVEKLVEKPAGTNAMQMTDDDKIRRDIFFTINANTITPEEAKKVQEIVDFMKANPNSTVSVTGHADKGTGNAKLNMRLSQRRANAVVNLLKKKGIPASRIKSDYKGDTVQPFAENDKNRVSVCIAE